MFQTRKFSRKYAEGTEIESLQAYLLISQDQAKIDSFQRYESGKWLYETQVWMALSASLHWIAGCHWQEFMSA